MLRIGSLLALFTAALLLTAGTAAAHPQAFATTNPGGSLALVQLSIPHGCDTAGTTEVKVNFPKEIVNARPVVTPGWTANSSAATDIGHGAAAMKEGDMHGGDTAGDKATHAEPAAGDGTVLTWTADKPLPAHDLGTVTAHIVVPEAGGHLWLPTVQTCENGDTYEWITKEADAEHPAPAVMFDATDGGHGAAAADSDDAGEQGAAADTDAAASRANIAIGVAAFAALLALVAAVRRRR